MPVTQDFRELDNILQSFSNLRQNQYHLSFIFADSKLFCNTEIALFCLCLVSVWQSATLLPISCKSVHPVPAKVEEPVVASKAIF